MSETHPTQTKVIKPKLKVQRKLEFVATHNQTFGLHSQVVIRQLEPRWLTGFWLLHLFCLVLSVVGFILSVSTCMGMALFLMCTLYVRTMNET
jgi:hypothetical protein